MKTLGQIAYKSIRTDLLRRKEVMLNWHELVAYQKAIYESVALAVRDAVLEECIEVVRHMRDGGIDPKNLYAIGEFDGITAAIAALEALKEHQP